jgi:hypothetical protein
LESWEVKVGCPITSRAACPPAKSAAHTAAAENKNIVMRFMGNLLGPGVWILIFNYRKAFSSERMMTGVTVVCTTGTVGASKSTNNKHFGASCSFKEATWMPSGV